MFLAIAQFKDNDLFVLILAALPAALALSGDKHPSLASRSRSSLVRENPAKRPASHGARHTSVYENARVGFRPMFGLLRVLLSSLARVVHHCGDH